VILSESDEASAQQQTRLLQSSGDFSVHAYDGQNLSKGAGYTISKNNTTGQFEQHKWHSNGTEVGSLDDTGLQLNDYGSGTVSGTATYSLAVDQYGNVIEEALGASNLPDLGDVTITAAATGEVLRYNGSAWVDAQLDYSDLSGTPTLGTAAATASTDYATAAQGALADTAVQPNTAPTFNGTTVTSDLTLTDSTPAITLNDTDGVSQFASIVQEGPKLILRSRNNASNGTVQLQGSNGTTATPTLTCAPDNQVQLNQYGSGTYTGTAAYSLAVDASGDIIEEPVADPTGVAIAMAIVFG
jgi:hypothetical protein